MNPIRALSLGIAVSVAMLGGCVSVAPGERFPDVQRQIDDRLGPAMSRVHWRLGTPEDEQIDGFVVCLQRLRVLQRNDEPASNELPRGLGKVVTGGSNDLEKVVQVPALQREVLKISAPILKQLAVIFDQCRCFAMGFGVRALRRSQCKQKIVEEAYRKYNLQYGKWFNVTQICDVLVSLHARSPMKGT